MHTGKSYKLFEFLVWTRRTLFWLIIWNAIIAILYEVLDLKWMHIPWQVVALLGTATAFIVGFKNVQTYNRTWEARQIWGAAMSSSRGWTMICRDFIPDAGKAKKIIYRHIAWLTALRYQLRVSKPWETTDKSYNKEYKRYYTIPEKEIPMDEELLKYISKEELKSISSKNNKATQILNLQSTALKDLNDEGLIDNFRFMEMHSALREFCSHQGKSERIKNFPYPRQYATVNNFFIKLFCILLPFGLLGEFANTWAVIPFSVLLSWVYTSLEQVGESTENPFEGSSNDVPISQMTRAVEIDMKEMLGETDLPPVLQPQHNIIL